MAKKPAVTNYTGWVRATRPGHYGGQLRQEGESFAFSGKLGSWMQKCDKPKGAEDPPSISSAEFSALEAELAEAEKRAELAEDEKAKSDKRILELEAENKELKEQLNKPGKTGQASPDPNGAPVKVE